MPMPMQSIATNNPMATTASPSPMPMPAVLVLCSLHPAITSALAARFRLLDFYASPLAVDAFIAEAAADADPPRVTLVFGSGPVRVDAGFLDRVPSLRCVITISAGVNHIDLAECARRGITVANAGTTYSSDVADYAVGLLVDVLRRVSAAERHVRRRLWPAQGGYWPLGSKLGGKRVGIVGLGSIGSSTAKRLEAFGCVIHYYSRRPKEAVSYKYFPNVRDLAAECDVLVVSCALTDETRHIIDKDVLQALGKDGIIVNIARGAHIDEAELVRALKEGEIGGAGLDVFEHEPNVPRELFSMDNVVLTAHQAVFTAESMSDLCWLAIGNLEAFFSGKPLLTPVVLPE